MRPVLSGPALAVLCSALIWVHRAKGFSDRICAVVEKHVDAKRYLVATEPGYKEKLSEASLKTLEYQGGPMNTEEVILFKQQPFFTDIIKVRLWDDQAKDTKAVTLPLDHFAQLIREYLGGKN